MKARVFSLANSLIFLSIMMALISCGGGKGTDVVAPPPSTGDSGQKTDQTGTVTSDSIQKYLEKLKEEGVIVDEATVRDQFKKYVTKDPPTAGEIINFVSHSNPGFKADIDKQREALCKIVNAYSELVTKGPDFVFLEFNPFSSLTTNQRMARLLAWNFIPSAHAEINLNATVIEQSSIGNVAIQFTPGAALVNSINAFITASNTIRDRLIAYLKIFSIDATAPSGNAVESDAETFVNMVTANLEFKDTVTNKDAITTALAQFFTATTIVSAQKNYTWFRAYNTSIKSVPAGIATCTDNLQGNVTFTPASETANQGFYTKKIDLKLNVQPTVEFIEQIDFNL